MCLAKNFPICIIDELYDKIWCHYPCHNPLHSYSIPHSLTIPPREGPRPRMRSQPRIAELHNIRTLPRNEAICFLFCILTCEKIFKASPTVDGISEVLLPLGCRGWLLWRWADTVVGCVGEQFIYEAEQLE